MLQMQAIILQVSIYGHSLGSVLSYDILCHQENLCSSHSTDSVYMECSEKEAQVDATCQLVSSNNEMSDKIASAMIEENSIPDTYSVVHAVDPEDLYITVNPIATVDLREDCAVECIPFNAEVRSQVSVEKQINSRSLLAEDNRAIDHQSATTSDTGENLCDSNLDVSDGLFETNDIISGCMPDEIIGKGKIITSLEEEVLI